MTIVSPDEVRAFWFGAPITSEEEAMARIPRWFTGDATFDREVTARFGPTVEAALEGRLDDWAATPPGRLALVIVLDQLTRNVFRDQPRMYAGDPRAQQLALQAFADGTAAALAPVERFFLSMPLLHAEDLGLQRRLGEISAQLAREAPPPLARFAAMHQEQSAKYTSVIERFGRFPHRNQLLGRVSTPEEVAFLADWAEKGPPTGAPRPPREP
jgi:uncharacterized protein (DUF924 family)